MKFNIFSHKSILVIICFLSGLALMLILFESKENYGVTPYRTDLFVNSLYQAFNSPPALLDVVAK